MRMVLLFSDGPELYCWEMWRYGQEYRGHVVNGGWDMCYDPVSKKLSSKAGADLGRFTLVFEWKVPPNPSRDYNEVIAQAHAAYLSHKENIASGCNVIIC